MTKSELISALSTKQSHLSAKDIDLAVSVIISHMVTTLASGDRIEIRGFGGFTLKSRKPRIGRNPKTGKSISVPLKHCIHFKPGLDMRNRINDSRLIYKVIQVA